MDINGRTIGVGSPYIIAEAADAHYGSLDMAIALADMAKGAGADAVKFQHHIPEAEMLRDIPDSDNMREPLWDFLVRCALKLNQHKKLAQHCHSIGIDYLCTPFSWAAAVEIAPLTPVIKVGSGEAQDFPYLERLMTLGKPLIVSTGMCTSIEVEDLYNTLEQGGADFALLHCVSEYPPRYEDLNIGFIQFMRAIYDCPIGYSDHTPSIATALAAVALGASIIEKHITLNRVIAGPDSGVSITDSELQDLVRGAEAIYLAEGAEKIVHNDEAPIRKWAYRSIVFTQDLKAGTVLTSDHMWGKRPGTGILTKRMPEFIGKTLACDVHKDDMLKENVCV